jgi:hypothetical protein
MWLAHATGKPWYKILQQHTLYVISLSNNSIKTNFKQITRIELKLTNLYKTLRGTALCTYVNCCRSFTEVTLLFDHFQCHCTIVRQHSFLINMDRTVAHGNEKMTMNSQYEWMNIKKSLSLRCWHWCGFPRIPMIWRHDKVVQQRAEKISRNVTPFFYHHSVVIQHLLSDTLYQTGYFLQFQRKTYIMLDRYPLHT